MEIREPVPGIVLSVYIFSFIVSSVETFITMITDSHMLSSPRSMWVCWKRDGGLLLICRLSFINNRLERCLHLPMPKPLQRL